MHKTRYWIGMASRAHALIRTKGGFAPFGHGRLGPAKRLSQGDWVIYYSSKEKLGEPELCQKFTAIGRVIDAEPTQVEQSPRFKPYRRKVKYRTCRAVHIRPLIPQLSFIRNKSRWGWCFDLDFLKSPRQTLKRLP